jgi:hypothetical protein
MHFPQPVPCIQSASSISPRARAIGRAGIPNSLLRQHLARNNVSHPQPSHELNVLNGNVFQNSRNGVCKACLSPPMTPPGFFAPLLCRHCSRGLRSTSHLVHLHRIAPLRKYIVNFLERHALPANHARAHLVRLTLGFAFSQYLKFVQT